MAHAISFKSAALTSALAILSMASAHGATDGYTFTVTRDPFSPFYGVYLQMAPDNTSQLTLSPVFSSTLNLLNARVEALEPGTLTSTVDSQNNYNDIQVTMPVPALYGTVPTLHSYEQPVEMSSVFLSGGLRRHRPDAPPSPDSPANRKRYQS